MIKQSMFIGALFSLCSLSSAYAMGNAGTIGKNTEEECVKSLLKSLYCVESTTVVYTQAKEYQDISQKPEYGTISKLIDDESVLGLAEAAKYCEKIMLKTLVANKFHDAKTNHNFSEIDTFVKMLGVATANYEIVKRVLQK